MNDPVQPQRAPREWVELTTITNPTSPLVVRVQTTASGRPLYSMEIGIVRDGRVLRHMPVFTAPDGLVTPFDMAALQGMIRAAEEAVAVDAGRKAVEWQGRMNARDAQGRRGGPPARDDRQREGRRGERRERRSREDDARWR